MAIPDSMRAVQLRAYDGKPESIAVVEIPVPRPGPGEVLVRVFGSPINPSDLMFIRGLYGFKKPLPAVPGFEGQQPIRVPLHLQIEPRLRRRLAGAQIGPTKFKRKSPSQATGREAASLTENSKHPFVDAPV